MPVATKYAINVNYNGVTRILEIEGHESVVSVLQRAIQLFGVTQQPHLLSLFTASGQAVDERESAAAAGLAPGTEVFLRQNVVKGG
jgi:hypothetical protein